MKKLLIAAATVFALALAPTSFAASDGVPLEKAPDRSTDMTALQNGAKLFVNYCLNCHNASMVRYNRLLELGLTPDQIKNNLLFTGEKVGDLMKVSMTANDAKKWFGAQPPDLSLIARARSINAGPSGSDWVYTYLRTYYKDASRPTGWNNLVYPNVGMPHVMWDRQGLRELTLVTTTPKKDANGKFEGGERVTTTYDAAGFATVKVDLDPNFHGHHETKTYKFTPANADQSRNYDKDVADLAGFLKWASEPAGNQRWRLGVLVMLFLSIFTVFAWVLNRNYWKDIK